MMFMRQYCLQMGLLIHSTYLFLTMATIVWFLKARLENTKVISS